MGKTLLKAAGVILAILIAGFFALTLTLDGIVKSGIQQNGSTMLKTEVNVDDVALSMFDGKGTIDGLMIHNPEGFEDRPAIQFRQIEIEIDLSTLFSDTVVVDNLVIQNPSIYAEQTTEGNNLKILQNRTQSSSSSSSSYSAYLVIDQLLIRESSVHLKSKIGEERNIETNISELELSGIGREGNNTIAQTTQQVLEPLLQRALREAVKRGVMDAVENKLQDLISG